MKKSLQAFRFIPEFRVQFPFVIIIIFLLLAVTGLNAQDVPVSVGPAPLSNYKVTPQEPTPFAVGTRAFTQISSSPTFQFGKSYLETCTITNIGTAFTITFPGGLMYKGGTVYTFNQSSPYQVWSIDTVTGTHTLKFNVTGVPLGNFTGMCWDGTTVYGVGTSITASQIFSINWTTGAATLIGSQSTVSAGAISLMCRPGAQYSLFSHDIVSDALHKWNKTTGVASLVGALGFDANFGQDGGCDPNDNKFYLMAYNNTTGAPQLRTVDTATGTGALLCTYLAQATGIACVPYYFPPPPGIVTIRCRNGLNVDVPDNNPTGRYDTIFVIGNDDCFVADINVRIDTFTHTWDSDMQFSLSHTITTVALITNRGSSGDNFIGTILNDSAANPISSGTAPFTGSFRSEQPLTAYNSQSAGGRWVLFMADQKAGDTGFLKAWCIQQIITCPVGGIRTVEIPFTYILYQNYPNPFNPVTTIKYGLPRFGNTNLVIYDILGKVVKTLVDNELKDAGTYEVGWDASNFSSGIYFYTLESGNYKETKKMVLIK